MKTKSLNSDVKNLQADNALLFKKIVKLQEQIVSFMNTEDKSKFSSAESKRDEETKFSRAKSMINEIDKDFEIEFEEVKEKEKLEVPIFTNNFSIPSKPVHKKVVDE